MALIKLTEFRETVYKLVQDSVCIYIVNTRGNTSCTEWRNGENLNSRFLRIDIKNVCIIIISFFYNNRTVINKVSKLLRTNLLGAVSIIVQQRYSTLWRSR